MIKAKQDRSVARRRVRAAWTTVELGQATSHAPPASPSRFCAVIGAGKNPKVRKSSAVHARRSRNRQEQTFLWQDLGTTWALSH
jgi:hypothetical protein